MNRNIDLAIGILVIALGVAVLLIAKDIRPTGPVVDPIGPRAFPYIIGVFFLIGGSRIVYVRLRNWHGESGPIVANDGEPDEPDVPASALQAFAVMSALALYAFTLGTAGYVLATPIFIAVGLKAMRVKSLPVIFLTALLYTAVTYVIFAYYMRVALPLGPLADLFRSFGLAR